MYKPESREAKLGEWGEKQADKIRLRQGKLIIPLALCGRYGAAMIVGKTERIVLMDRGIIGPDGLELEDVKAKSQSTFWRKRRVSQHGIDACRYLDYWNQCQRMQLRGTIMVIEKSNEVAPGQLVPTNVALVYPLDMFIRWCPPSEMREVVYGRGGMVYWDRDSFIEAHSIEG